LCVFGALALRVYRRFSRLSACPALGTVCLQAQRKVLEDNYAQHDDAKIAAVKALWSDFDIILLRLPSLA